MNAANEVRPIMHYLSILAEKYQCAIVLISHLNKNWKTKAGYRGLGSVDFSAAARSILLCARSPDDPDLKIIAPLKSSLCYKATAVAFRLSMDGGFQWEGECDVSADELLTEKTDSRKLDKAKELLKTRLADGSMPSSALEAEAISLGIGKRTLKTARKELGVISRKAGSAWYLILPETKQDD
jgi:hypothetical protein